MSSFGWIHLIWLVVTLAVMVSAFGSYRIGLRRSVVMILAWIGIFLVAAGIVWLIVGEEPGPMVQPDYDADAIFI